MITEEIEEGTPWAMLFADDLVLCDPYREIMDVSQRRKVHGNNRDENGAMGNGGEPVITRDTREHLGKRQRWNR